jgi:phage replication O-like protein O
VSHGPRENGAVTGAALREAIAQACSVKPALTSKEWRAFSAIVSRTVAYGRLEDRVTHPVLAELAGLHPSDLSKALRRLAELGVVEYEPGRGRRFSIVRLTKAVSPPLAAAESAGRRRRSPDSEVGDVALVEVGDVAYYERNGLPERTTERTERVDTRSRGDRAALAASSPIENSTKAKRRPIGTVCPECGVALAFGHSAECPTLGPVSSGATT